MTNQRQTMNEPLLSPQTGWRGLSTGGELS